ncbi:polysaccharide deacetylase family protein [Albibacterium sp.]|uniref:polysaccharide deacetylase family protein n=1 Tax=Albibacterium sp. TaxID=2952885 RepID=UPI002CF9329C|nr:polysaccharide deacetylase family protein [Albibacterium sp.]HUH18624.1 polysaccharide deacetylase family protein [Albibacterium sp.]
MKLNKYVSGLILILILSSCQSQNATDRIIKGDLDKVDNELSDVIKPAEDTIKERKMASAAEILAKKQVPILCYHQIRDWTAKDSKSAKDYITPINVFKDQIKALADSGYTSILPDQLYNYLVYGDELPEKPVMLTFDDNDLSQYENAAPVLKQYGFKGVYFIMTVTIGRPRYMSKEQIRELFDDGNAIGNHTWDHHNVKKYEGDDWITQLEKPKKVLEDIVGEKVVDFAYPFGLWSPEILPELEKRGIRTAFILSTKRDENQPLLTIRRMIASGFWGGKTLVNVMGKTFAESRN